MRKTLFLGFDGVLHGVTRAQISPFCRLPLLEAALVGRPVDIVVTSSWRTHHRFLELKSMLGSLSEQVVSLTGSTKLGRYCRYEEIREYVAVYQVVDWRALDDSVNEFPSHEERLIACNPKTGLEERQIRAIEAWLDT